MKNISNKNSSYVGIAFLYEKWCTGDAGYASSLLFYVDYLKKMKGPFLELGIETGRIALEIIKSCPNHIVGIDISKNMLDICQKKYDDLIKQKKNFGTLELIQMDMEKMNFRQAFQVVYLPFRTIGHIMSDSALISVFKKVYNALQNGGLFILDHYMFCYEWAKEHNCVDISMYKDNCVEISDYYEYDFDKKYMKCSIMANNEIIQHFTFRWLSPDTIYKAALSAGFNVECLYGDFDKSNWNESSSEQIWVLKK